MAKPLLSDELWAVIAPLLPPVPPRPQGGRPRLDDRKALTGILFVLWTGPNPTDRGKAGSKRHALTDRAGIPLAIGLSPANRHDSRDLEALVDAVRPIRQGVGRPRKRPAKLHADKAYDHRRCRRALRRRGIVARIARRGVDSSQRLGRHRWVVERTLAWFARFRRLTIRYERRADIHLAFTRLAACLICWNFIQRWFC